MNTLLLVSFIAWIVYWVQVSELAKRLRWLKRPEYSPEELNYVEDLKPDRDDR